MFREIQCEGVSEWINEWTMVSECYEIIIQNSFTLLFFLKTRYLISVLSAAILHALLP